METEVHKHFHLSKNFVLDISEPA